MVHKLWLKNTQNIRLFDVCNFDLHAMTLVFNLHLDMVVTYLHAKIGSIGQRIQKLWHGQTDTWADTQTNGQIDRQTCVKHLPTHSRGR